MSIDLANYRTQAQKAVKRFWRNRSKEKRKLKAAGKNDQGNRSEVTAGNNMNGFLDLIKDIVRLNGLQGAKILANRADAKTGAYSELSPLTDLKTFVTTLAGHIAAEAAR